MCEWLSSVQWCDVHLVCGGRSFSAHRAVLASVSRFLRRVLLSCPQEETPTFIVLPDFDLEALSSVLYYIYNGEVIVDKPKLLMFLDVIKTLEIFIDNQDLQKLRDSIGDRNLDLCTYRECKLYENVFALSTGNGDGQEYVNIRKGECSRNTCLQYAVSDSDLVDKPECNRWHEAQPSMDYPPATFVDRQRNSYLRDLYIETYPQNGNVNGLTQGVLAISNERYRAPTSVLLPNANGKLPSRAGDTFLEISRKTADLSSYIPNAPRKPRIQNSTRQNGEPSSRRFHDFKNLDFNNTKMVVNNSCHLGNSLDNSWLRICPPDLIPPSLENQKIRSTLPNSLMPSMDLSKTKSNADYVAPSPSINSQNYLATVDLLHRNLNRNLRKYPMDRRYSMRNNITKAPIFNQVLDSPWCPRLPYNYKPFRRKLSDVPDFERHDKKENKVTSDTNNNDEQLVLPAQCESVVDVDIHNAKKEFKCAVCNQMFTSDECLSTHMKRHSTAARYSCGECGKTFSQLRNFKYHMSVHRGTREFAATCTVCGKYFNDRGYLSSHMKIHRNRKEYKCTLCPKSFNQRVAYNMHVRIHTGVKPHVCEECGKAFSRKMLLKQHQRTHSGERPYACAHCDKRFADRSNMTLHLRLHTGVKPFSCSLCPKSFTKKHHLKSHLNFHTGAKPYSCPRCNLAFTQSSNMRTHMKKCNVSHDETNT